MDEPPIPDHPLRQQAEADLARVIQQITRLTGLQTRWRGTVEVEDIPFPYWGQKQRTCSISLRRDALAVPERRWTTMIHEAVHSVSAVFTLGHLDARQARWEEAIAERLQRLLRNDILRALDVTLDERILTELDAAHLYNGDIRTLDVSREALKIDPRTFYLDLLAATVDRRARIVILASRAYRTEREREP